MIDARIVPAEVGHIAAISADAREADERELWAQGRTTPAEAMHRGMQSSRQAFTGLLDGEPVCMFGATPYSILGGMGTPWMIGSNGLTPLRAQKALLQESRAALAVLQHQFPTMLFNTVDDRNTSAKRWLKWLGFTLLDPIPYGPDRLPFRPFYWSHPHV